MESKYWAFLSVFTLKNSSLEKKDYIAYGREKYWNYSGEIKAQR